MRRAEAPLFLGLTRPARYAGLPVGYFALWAGGSTIAYIVLETAWIAALALLSYALLRVIAERDPHYFEIVANTLKVTPPTRNRRIWGGDSYDA